MATPNRSRIFAVLAAGILAAAGASEAQIVRCEAVGGKNGTCPAATPNGVALARQLGGAGCTLGVSWGWDANGIWVSKNCRGEFRLKRDPNVPEKRLACDSDHGRMQRCAADTASGLLFVPEDSGAKCVSGKTWGWDKGSVWVNGNCSASFSFTAAERGRLVRCEAPGDQRVSCALDIDGGVTLEQLHRQGPCAYGQNWGLDAHGVWVDPSCGATFRADGRLRGTRSWSEPNEVACEAFGDALVSCPADTSSGVRIEVEASSGVCEQDRNWGFDAHAIWVSGGCRALFHLGL